MDEFLSKFHGRGIKIEMKELVNSILVKPLFVFNILRVAAGYRVFALSLHLLLVSQYQDVFS